MRLAVIPARGGSKRIPRKNIRPFAGQPMIAWSIRAARDSGCFDRVIVSTDDAEIADVARAHGAEVPFVRPPELSDDHTPTIPVIAHAIQWYLDRGEAVDAACCIYATAPFVRAEDLRAGLAALTAEDCAYVFSATSFPFPIQRAIRINAQGRAETVQHAPAQEQPGEGPLEGPAASFLRAAAMSLPLIFAGSAGSASPRRRYCPRSPAPSSSSTCSTAT